MLHAMPNKTGFVLEGGDVASPPSVAGAGTEARGGGAAAPPPARGSAPWVRQVSFLADENRRLKSEVTGLSDALKAQSAASLAERRQLLAIELAAAEARRATAEAEVRRAVEETQRAAAAAQAAQIDKETAAQASESARRTLEERRAAAEAEAATWERRLAVAERELALAEAQANATHVSIERIKLEVSLKGDCIAGPLRPRSHRCVSPCDVTRALLSTTLHPQSRASSPIMPQ